MLASLHIMELEQRREVICWLRDFYPEEHKRMLCITFQKEWLQGRSSSPETLKCSVNEEHWNELQNRLKAQRQDLTKTFVDSRICPTRASLFCFYDLSLDRQSKDRPTSIADIKPRTGERHALDRRYKSILMDKFENASRPTGSDASFQVAHESLMSAGTDRDGRAVKTVYGVEGCSFPAESNLRMSHPMLIQL